MRARSIVFLLASVCLGSGLPLAGSSFAQAAKNVVRTQDNLPRYSYSVAGTATAPLQADDAGFAPFAADRRAFAARQAQAMGRGSPWAR